MYSNVLGYLGGVNFTLLLGKICLLYPRADAAQLLDHFFQFYAVHNWNIPISLLPVQPDYLNLDQWSLSNPLDTNLMPLITAGYPAMISTYNVSEETLSILRTEFARGAAFSAKGNWEGLCRQYDFFSQFASFFMVELVAGGKVELQKMIGYSTPLYRKLLDGLEEFVHVRPWPENFVENVGGVWVCRFYAGLGGSRVEGVEKVAVGGLMTWFASEVLGWKGRDSDMKLRMC